MSTYKKGDKFIVEIGEVMETEGGKPIYKVKGYNTLVFDNNGLDRLEQVKEEEPEPEEWPMAGENYFSLTSRGNIDCSEWRSDEVDNDRLAVGNVFRTWDEAEARADLLRWLAADPARWRKVAMWEELRTYTDEPITANAYVVYDLTDGKVKALDAGSHLVKFAEPKFSLESAKRAILEIGEERLKRDWFGVE